MAQALFEVGSGLSEPERSMERGLAMLEPLAREAVWPRKEMIHYFDEAGGRSPEVWQYFLALSNRVKAAEALRDIDSQATLFLHKLSGTTSSTIELENLQATAERLIKDLRRFKRRLRSAGEPSPKKKAEYSALFGDLRQRIWNNYCPATLGDHPHPYKHY